MEVYWKTVVLIIPEVYSSLKTCRFRTSNLLIGSWAPSNSDLPWIIVRAVLRPHAKQLTDRSCRGYELEEDVPADRRVHGEEELDMFQLIEVVLAWTTRRLVRTVARMDNGLHVENSERWYLPEDRVILNKHLARESRNEKELQRAS